FLTAEGGLQFDRYAIRSAHVDMNLNALSLNLTAGVGIDVFQPDFLRFFAGVSPMLLLPSYDRVEAQAYETYDFEEMGTRFALTFPVGVVVQDVLRLGVRFTASDEFDGAVGSSGAGDFLTFLHVGYRFDLLRP
ncbi:MAG: hypothetical protein R3362_13600, partial [Rhodothermales bacterium]|nr:hypothetical protein [Rhodothermales bacterium]